MDFRMDSNKVLFTPPTAIMHLIAVGVVVATLFLPSVVRAGGHPEMAYALVDGKYSEMVGALRKCPDFSGLDGEGVTTSRSEWNHRPLPLLHQLLKNDLDSGAASYVLSRESALSGVNLRAYSVTDFADASMMKPPEAGGPYTRGVWGRSLSVINGDDVFGQKVTLIVLKSVRKSRSFGLNIHLSLLPRFYEVEDWWADGDALDACLGKINAVVIRKGSLAYSGDFTDGLIYNDEAVTVFNEMYVSARALRK